MNLRDWNIISILYEFNSITKAAQHMFISQPALTARIKQIESYFGVSIILRGYKGIQFTSEGEYLAKQAKEIVRQHDQIKEYVLSMNSRLTGTIKLGASNYFIKYKLPMILQNFKKTYPYVECHVLTGWGRDIFKKVQDRDVDIAFIRGDYPWKGEKEFLFEEKLSVASVHSFEWEDLPLMPRVDYYNPDRKLITLLEDWWNENYDHPPYVGLRVDRLETCKDMIINGFGYGIVPNLIFKDYPNVIIKTLMDNYNQPIIRKTWIYYYRETLANHLVKVFVDFINSMDVKHL